MSKLFRSRSTKGGSAPHPPLHHHLHDELSSQYSSLLDPVLTLHHQQPLHSSSHRRVKSATTPVWAHAFSSTSPDLSRSWLAAAEGRSSWTGERPPTRKLVKDPNGSGRPSFSVELSDNEGDRDKSLLRRQLARLKELYRKGDK